MQCNTDKNLIRAEMKALRKNLDKNEITQKSAVICGAFLKSSLFEKSKNICVYMSAFNEVDTMAVIEECARAGKKVCVPCVDGNDISLALYSSSQLSGAFGIKEPACRVAVDKTEVDVFVVPALAFDRRGARVGFGKGYYDKLLSGTDAVKIGFLYDFQLFDNIRVEEHDIFMDYLFTEGMVIDCETEI